MQALLYSPIMAWAVRILRCRRTASFLKGKEIVNLTRYQLANKPPDPSSVDLPNLLQEEMVKPFEEIHKIDPEQTSILVFPGQGSQRVGMVDGLLEYPNVKDMFNVASDILNFDLLHYCQNGPQSELDRTVHCQPAVMVTSLAGVEKLQVIEPQVLEKCCACAGYSVGEFAALVFAGALSFEDAMTLVRVRSRAMQEASNNTESKMVTAYGGASTPFKLACQEAREYCKLNTNIDDPVCTVSAYLAPNVVTLAGHTTAINYVEKHARKFKISRIFQIPVSGAFHTKLMWAAVPELKSALNRIHVDEPLIKVYSNLTGQAYTGPSDIRRNLPDQVVQPVKWEQVVHKMLSRPPKHNMPDIYDVGPGNQLGVLLKKCNGKAWKNYVTVSNLEQTE